MTGAAEPARRRLLIVEDEVLIAMDLEASLVPHGFDVVAICDNAQDALAMVEAHAPDLVLMDISIRGETDGIETARRILRRRDLPIVFLTAYGDEATVARAAEVSPYGYLLKPVDERGLFATLRVALERHELDVRSRFVERAFDAAAVGFTALDVRGEEPRVVYANDGFTRLTGVPRERALGRGFGFWAADEESDGMVRLRDAFAARRAHVETIACRRAEGGESFWASVGLAPVVDRSGAIRHMTVVLVDVTAQIGFESAISDNQRLVLVGRMTAGLVHDLNNLLAAILSFAGLVRESLVEAGQSGIATAPWIEDLDEILLAGKRAALLNRRMLDFSRRRGSSRPTTLELGRALTDARRLLEQACGARITLELRPGPGRLFAFVDPVECEQILLNLVTNARDAMPSGGRIVIAASQPLERSGRFEAGRYVRLCVTDTGCGMTPEVAARAFEPLFTTKPEGLGTGLGLHSTRSIVERDGGQVRLQSAPGAGTTITIELPLRSIVAADELELAVEAPPDTIEDEGCALVEGDPVVRRAMARVLARAGFEVFEAQTAELALERLEQDPTSIGLIVYDGTLPGPGPTGILERARSLAPHLAVVVTASAGDVELGRRALPAELLLKPFGGDTLARRAVAAVEARRQRLACRQSGERPASPPATLVALPAEVTESGGASHFADALRALTVLYQPIVLTRDGSVHAYEALVGSRVAGLEHPRALAATAAALGRGEALGAAARAAIAADLDLHPERKEPIFVAAHPSEFGQSGVLAANDPLRRHASRIVLQLTERQCVDSCGALQPVTASLRTLGFRLAVDDVSGALAGLEALLPLAPQYVRLELAVTRGIESSLLRQDLVGSLLNLLRRHDVVAIAKGLVRPADQSLLLDRGCDLALMRLVSRWTDPTSI